MIVSLVDVEDDLPPSGASEALDALRPLADGQVFVADLGMRSLNPPAVTWLLQLGWAGRRATVSPARA
jgi:hypothetical protein